MFVSQSHYIKQLSGITQIVLKWRICSFKFHVLLTSCYYDFSGNWVWVSFVQICLSQLWNQRKYVLYVLSNFSLPYVMYSLTFPSTYYLYLILMEFGISMSSLYVCQLKPKKIIVMFIIFYLIFQLYFIRHFSLRWFPDQRMVRRHSRPLRGSGPTFPGSNHSRRVRSQVRRRTSARWEANGNIMFNCLSLSFIKFSNQTLTSSEKQI